MSIENFYVDDAIEQIRQKTNETSSNWVKKVMRKMKARHIKDVTIQRMRACLAIHHFGLPITTRLLGNVIGFEEKGKWYRLSAFLHGLGDKNLLVLKRGTTTQEQQWMVNPIFWDYFHNGWDDEDQGLDGSANE